MCQIELPLTFYALAMAGYSMNFQPEQKYRNEQIVEILIHSSIENFQPGQQPNSEQKADEMHVNPSYCQCDVSRRIMLVLALQ